MGEWNGIRRVLCQFIKVRYQILLYIVTTAIIVALPTILYNMSYNILNHAVEMNAEVYGRFTDIYYEMGDENHPFLVSETTMQQELAGYQYERAEQFVIVDKVLLNRDQMLCVGYGDESAIDLAGIQFQEGKYPVADNEVALTKTMMKALNANKIGDCVEINQKIYIVSGILKDYGRLWAKGEQQTLDQAVTINAFLAREEAQRLAESEGLDYHIWIFSRLTEAEQSYDSNNRYFFFNQNASVGKMVVFEIPSMFHWMMYGFALIMSYAVLGLYAKKEREQTYVLYLLGMKKKSIYIYLILKYMSYSMIGALFGIIIGVIGSKVSLHALSENTTIMYPNQIDWSHVLSFVGIVMLIHLVVGSCFIWHLMKEKLVLLKESKNLAYQKTGLRKMIFWEYMQNKKMFFILMLVITASMVLFLYSVQYQINFKNSSGYMEYDGKMPYDYDYGWETIMRQGDDRKSLDQETVIGIEEEEEFAWVDSLELDGMQREMLDQMQKEDGIQTVLGYKQDSRCFVKLDLEQMDDYLDGFDYILDGDFYSTDDISENVKQYFGYSERERYVPSCFMGYSEEELESFSQYVTEGEIHLDKILAGEEIVLMVPDYQITDVNGTNYMFPVNPETEGAYEDTLFEVGDEVSLTELQTLQKYTGMITEEECPEYLKRRDFTVKIGAIIRSHIGWFDYSLGPRKAYTFLTLNDAFQQYGLEDVTYSRVRIYTKPLSDSNQLREIMASYQSQLTTMKLTNLQEELTTYKQYKLCLESFTGVIFVICILIMLVTFGSQMIEKTILYQRKYALLRICGMKRRTLEYCVVIQAFIIWVCGVLVSVPILYLILGQQLLDMMVSSSFLGVVAGSAVIVFVSLLPCLGLIRKSKIIM